MPDSGSARTARQTDNLLAAMAAVIHGHRSEPDAIDRLAGADAVTIADLADRQGVLPLLAEHAAAEPRLSALANVLTPRVRARAALDLVAEQALREALHGLHRSGVQALVFKGAQLAYACYEYPHLRPRLDADILVRPADRERAGRTLRDHGYHPMTQVEADLIMFQQTYVLGDPSAPQHVIDLHWRLTNAHEFVDYLDTESLFSRAIPIPALGSAARGLSVVDALIVALLHPVAHHGNAAHLIWDIDTARVVARMTPPDWGDILRRFSSPPLAAIAAVRLERAREWGGATIDPSIVRELAGRASAADLAQLTIPAGSQPEWRAFTGNLRSLPGWRTRLRFVRQHLTPPAEYMRHVYAPGSRAPLPALYVTRAVRGLVRWLAPHRRAGRHA